MLEALMIAGALAAASVLVAIPCLVVLFIRELVRSGAD